MSGATSGYPGLSLSNRSDSVRSNPWGKRKLGNTTHVIFASDATEWLMPRSVRYLVSLGGNKAVLPTRAFCARIDQCWRCEKAQPVPDFYDLLVPDL